MNLLEQLKELAAANELRLLTEPEAEPEQRASSSGWDTLTAQPIISVDGADQVALPIQRTGLGDGSPVQYQDGFADWRA